MTKPVFGGLFCCCKTKDGFCFHVFTIVLLFLISYLKQVNRNTVTFVFAGEQRFAIPGPVMERFLPEGLSTPGGRSTGQL